jgi:site-specific recombinase XerD
MKTKKNIIRDLPRGVTIRETRNGHGRKLWRIRLGRKFTKAGVIERNFSSLDAARQFVHGDEEEQGGGVDALREKFGVSAVNLSPRELAEANEALCLLRSKGGATLREAVSFFLLHHAPSTRKAAKDALADLLSAKRTSGRVERYVDGLERQVASLIACAGISSTADLSRNHIVNWLATLQVGPVTKANALRAARIYCRFCLLRGWMPTDPTIGIDRPQGPTRETGILRPAQVRALLAASERDKRILPGLCLKLFAGIRSSELLALDWRDITASHVVVRAAHAKTRSRRAVEIPPNLASWLAKFRKKEGRVVTLHWRKWHRRLGKVAAAADKLLQQGSRGRLKKTAPVIGKLPQNFARHSFGTYHFALHQDEAKTAAAMGNTPAMVHRHYRALATADEAREFFGIMPPRVA